MTDHQRPGYILVVDDDEAVSDMIALVLGDEGYTVTCARDTAAALAHVAASTPDLILLDLSVGGLATEADGSPFRRLARVGAPIVVVSGQNRLAERAAMLGAVGHLPKPFDLADLIDVVQAALANDGAGGRPEPW